MGPGDKHDQYVFGPFRMLPDVCKLTCNGRPVAIQPKAFEILRLLVSRPDEVISREEIRTHVWGGINVESKNIGVQIVAVRKALEDNPDEPRYIETVPRRGYRFIAPVVREEGEITKPTPIESSLMRRVSVPIGLLLTCAMALALVLARTHREPDNRGGGVTVTVVPGGTPEARALYERGMYLYSHGGAGSGQSALGYFEEATRRDPAFAAPYAALAKTYVILADAQHLAKGPLTRAEDAARTALRLDPKLSDAWLTLGVTGSELHWDWMGAESAYQRAIELDPTNSTAHEWYGSFLALTGRTGLALREAKRAVQIEPGSPSKYHNLGEILLYAGDCQGAIDPLNSALQLNSRDQWSQYLLTRAYMCLDSRQQNASRLFFTKTLPAFEPPPLEDFAGAYQQSGAQGIGRALLKNFLVEDRVQPVDPVVLASAYAAVGERSKALDEIDRGLTEHASMLRHLAADPNFDVLRNEPRFKKALTTTRLPVFRHAVTTFRE